jgi:beta-lactamase class A
MIFNPFSVKNKPKVTTPKTQNIVKTTNEIKPTKVVEKYIDKNSDIEVQKYIDSLSADNNVEVEYINLESKRKIETNNFNELRESGSVYKLFIAQFILNQIDNGNLSWDSYWNNSKTISDGINQMILISDNDFPEAMMAKYGTQAIDSYLQSQGYSGIYTNEEMATTNANDLANLLVNLYKRNGFSDTNAKILLNLMGKQEFRDGIPSGAGTNSQVSDKVGFIDDTRNDAGIVSDKYGSYVLVVMTRNESNFDKVASITQSIEQARSTNH